MNKKAIYYSINDEITISGLKKGDDFELDKKKEETFLKYCKENKINSFCDKEIFLKKTKRQPYIMYYIGNYDLIKTKKIVGVVGPRQITNTTNKQIEDFFHKIKEFKDSIVIVSGLADGTDIIAHKLAIKYNIPTISVLGFGLAKALNSSSRHLIKEIVDNKGLVLSEFKLKQVGTNRTFPQRNRIIAGLSDLLFVPQARHNSGSLITVKDALEIEIPVYSCFSSYDDDTGIGTNMLINENKIKGIFDMDIFVKEFKEKLNIKKIKKETQLKLDKNEELVVKAIQSGFTTIDEICANIDLDNSIIINLLSEMELMGNICLINGDYSI